MSNSLEKRVGTLETTAKVLGIVAAVFGISGGFGAKALSSANSQITTLRADLKAADASLTEIRRREETAFADFVLAQLETAEGTASANAASLVAQIQQSIQAGTAVIGDQNDRTKSWKRVTISFGTAFASTPTVVLTPRTENEHDAFTTSVISVSPQQFTVEVRRVDVDSRWGQRLQLSWVAFDGRSGPDG